MTDISRLGRYELRHVLGQGAMGIVYEGYDPTLGRKVAVKTILQSHAAAGAAGNDYSVRFVREAKAAARLNHPNIVQIYDFGVEQGIAYIVMEFIKGRELRAFFDQDETFGIEETVRIMCELLDALEFAHQANVIHRDVKPANVMLDGQRRVKLTDFGVARIQDGPDGSQGGTMVGTPAYMSPEQVKGGKIDRRTDIFSAGSILYQFLTGERPFKGGGAWTVAKMIVQDDPPPPSTITETTSPVFDEVVKRALAKNPSDRFQTAHDFAVALKQGLDSLQGSPPESRASPRPEDPGHAASPSGPSPPRARSTPRASDTELAFWQPIQESADPAEFELYLEKFPDGTYASLARHKIAKLRGPRPPREAADSLGEETQLAPVAEPAPARRNWKTPVAIAISIIVLAAASVGGFVAFRGNKEAQSGNVADSAPPTMKQSPLATSEGATQTATQPSPTTAASPTAAAQSAAIRPGASFRDCDACPEMLVIPKGTFLMGSPQTEAGRDAREGMQHQVTIKRPFAAGKYEVTFDEWDTCVREGGCKHSPSDNGWSRGRRPVIDVSWDNAKEYIAWLSRKSGKAYRLLSEAEWEYAARAGSTTAFHTGKTLSPQLANYESSLSYQSGPTGPSQGKSMPVGSYAANAFGLHDMHGNVWEWVEDCKNASYNGAPSDGTAWTTGDCESRVLRGGCWDVDPAYARSAYRYWNFASARLIYFGFRVARDIEQ